jgi:hypothetical protein
MTSIFPDKSKGGLIVQEQNGTPVDQPDVENVDIPNGFVANCDVTALPDDCRVPVPQEQMNAVVSELLHLFAAMAPTLHWDCSTLGNLANAFIAFVTSLAGGSEGTPVCAAAESDGMEPGATMVYCDGQTIKLLNIFGDDSLINLIQSAFCSGSSSFPNTVDDYLLYCRQGVVRNTSAVDFQNYRGPWVQAAQYMTRHMVQLNGRLYSPNANIAAGTPFVIGTTGMTWYEVSPGVSAPYDPTNAYEVDTIISRNGKLYAANSHIPANTSFQVGTTGATWREVDFSQCFILPFDQTVNYKQYQVVTFNSLIYRATGGPVNAHAFNPEEWELIGGEKNIYTGFRDPERQYDIGDMILYNGRLFSPNGHIGDGSFNIGTSGATWYEVSPSVSTVWQADTAYNKDDIVAYKGAFYIANSNIVANVPPEGDNIGIGTGTWRPLVLNGQLILNDFDTLQTYYPNQLVAANAGDGTKGIWRFNTGKVASPFDFAKADLIGERNRYRGNWSQSVPYKMGDVVQVGNPGGYGPLSHFRATQDIPANTAFTIDFQNGAGGLWQKTMEMFDIFDPARAWGPGALVLSDGGLYKQVNTLALPAGPLTLGPNKWKMMNGSRGVRTEGGDYTLGPDDVGFYLRLNSANPKTITVPALAGFVPGDVLFGTSLGGQTTFVAAPGAVINTPDGLALRDKAGGATWTLTYAGLNTTTGNDEFDLAGDILVV